MIQKLLPMFREKPLAGVSVALTVAASTEAKRGIKSLQSPNRPVYFIFRVLKPYEEGYTMLGLKMAGVVWTILK